jgi:hypothetical protein
MQPGSWRADESRIKGRRAATAGLLALLLAFGTVGCNGDDDDDDIGSASPTATPAPDEGGHVHAVAVGSTEDGGGALAIDHKGFHGDVSVLFTACLGEGDSAEDCEGTVLYSNTVPGFNQSIADPSVYPLEDGTAIGLEIVAISAGASVRVNETDLLDEPGDSAELGMTPDFHSHPEWQVLVPAGEEHDSDFHLSFKLTTSSAQYNESDVFEWRLVPGEGDGHHDDGGDEHE